MIYYDLSLREDAIKAHYLSLEKNLRKKINDSPLCVKVKTFLLHKLGKILTGTPNEILQINADLKKIIPKKKSIKNNLITIFDYDSFVKKNKTKYNAYKLAEKLNVRVCLYCNRDYTLTVIKNGAEITRPEFDHFFDKATYPLLALSIYNLIPSCHICNSTLKNTERFDIATHVHPYIDDCLSHYHYTYKPIDVEAILGSNTDLEVKIVTDSTPISSKIKSSKDVFQLETIFSAHSEELKDLFDIRYRFSESYLTQLFETYKPLGISYEEAYRIAFGVHYNEEDFIKRPFSKLKKDILKELNIIK